ncbi:MAG TPA: endolytic transglycosylase MltG [Candidatus Limnocylindrales bacterium]
MSVRNGGGPRDPMAGPEPASRRRKSAYHRTGRYGRGPGDQRRFEEYGNGRGFGGLLRFVVFLAVMALVVLLVMVTVARPVLRMVVVPWTDGNPGSLRIGFVAELVREDLGAALTTPASNDPAAVEFVVETGDTPATVAPKLEAARIITSTRAFLYEAQMQDLASQLNAGRFAMTLNMTPAGVVDGLIHNRIVNETVNVTFREGLRLEQMTAKLMTVQGSKVDPQAFYDLVTKPTDALLGDYPWLLDTSVLPKGASLEGFLYPATYTLRIGADAPTTANDLVRMMLDAFYQRVGADRLAVAKSRGLTFHQVLTLASIVEREAIQDEERPLIAGVYQNRLDPKMWPTGLMQSDPTIFYVNDTLQLEKLKFADWTQYVFWAALTEQLPVPLPPELAGYNTYTNKGLPPGPICSPSLLSIEAALAPNTKTGYLFFIAKGDGTGTSAFAKTKAEHDKNVAKYQKKP